ncbi:hypothetical protein MHYP_G00111090 [Metynnis hypsauchen]
MYDIMDEAEKLNLEVKELYDSIRLQTAPSQEIRRKVDACSAVTSDLLKLMRVRLSEEGVEFDAEAERSRLCMLLDNEYARSTYGSTVSRVNAHSCNHSDHLSESPSISAKRAETAAQLAAKRAEIDMEAAIEAQRQQLKKLENQRDIDIIQARLNVYIEEESKERDGSGSLICSKVNDINPCTHPIPTQERQAVKNETSLVQALQESLSLTRLPTPEPTLFSGDPLKFTEWSTSFKALIERRCSNPADRLFYLQKYIAGEAKSFLEGSFYRKDEEAYQQAWKRLNARYGHSFVVQRAFREKLNMWPKIGGKEYIKLREFSDFLQTCSNAMSHIKGLQVLNDCEENQKMLVKLPEWVTSRWNRYVTKQLDEGQDYPSFNEFASFIAKEARIACNPVSSLHALRHSAETALRETKRSKANTFATNVKSPVSSSSTSKPDLDEIRLRDTGQRPKNWSTSLQNSYLGKCICCGENHSIHKCKRLTEMSIEEKKKCVHENKLCFACLRKGHNSKDCRNRAMCGICRKSHPTPLHEDRFPEGSKQSAAEESTSSLSCCVNGGEGGSTSMIVPVWISAPNTPETLAYALLDTQSSHTFVDQEVCEKLQVVMEPVRLKLSTMMGKDSIVKSQRVCDLKVRGLISDISISLPPAYTRDFIPLDCAHIPTCQTAHKWKHLASIAQEIPPLMECGVGLLIGYDCSRALIPRNVITGGDYEPYAIKTDLGWSIVGGTPQHVSPKDLTGLCHRVSVRELPPITPSYVIKALESDFADTKSSDKSISQEDICFLQILKEGIWQNEHGHLEMPLPFKVRPHLPDNKKLALARLKHLKRKLDRDPKFKNDYVKFMEGVFKDDDAEKVDTQSEPGKICFIRKHFYVDDGLISVKSVGEAIELVKEAQSVCAKGKLHLHKFLSNNREVLDSINIAERAVEVKNVDLNHDDLPMQRVLGIRWNFESNSFSFKVTLDEKTATRRGILSIVASLYDPLGFLAPFILEGKRVLQEMCQRGMGWDEPLPKDLKSRWESWMKDLENLEKIEIPRCFIPVGFGEVQRAELHHFSDASSQGYGQCSYIRLLSKEKVHCSLVMGKARVAPTKIVTIPRLELTAAVTSAAVSNMLREELEFKIDEEYYWTDSQVVLGYINNEARRFHVFVANRVQRIRETTDTRQWHYIDTEENPADHASRGLKVADLINSNWFPGPKFLWEREIAKNQVTSELLVGDPEVRITQVLKTEATRQFDVQNHLSRFSKWTTAVNVIARIQRLAKRIKTTEPLNVEERRQAARTIIKLVQQDAFREELNILNQKSGKLPHNHQLYQLDPFLHDGIMRVGGRLRKSSEPLELRHPRWHVPRRNMDVGDIVILKEEDIPRNEWKLAKVVEAHEDDDGLVRKVTVQIGERKLGKKGERLNQPSIVQRPIQKLVVLVKSS